METPEELVKMLNNAYLYLKQSREDGWYFNTITDVKSYAKVQLIRHHINFPHIIKHEGVLCEYACIHCGRGFNTPDYNSMKLHMKEGDTECDDGFHLQQCCCGKKFDTLEEAYEHNRSTNCQFQRWQREQTQPKKQVVIKYTDHDDEEKEEAPREVKRVMTEQEKKEETKRRIEARLEELKQQQEDKKRKRKEKREAGKEERERKKAEKKKEREEQKAQKKKEDDERKAQEKAERKKQKQEEKKKQKEELKKQKQEKRKCECCNVVFRGPQEQERHMNGKFHKLKSNPNVLSCSHCEMVFQRQKHLDDHLLTKKHLRKIQECLSSSLPKNVCASSCEV